MIVTVILNGSMWRIEIAFGTDLETLEEGWRVEQVARLNGMGMAYCHIQEMQRWGTKREALADGMRIVAVREGVDD
jgi:hypothetical protein